MNRRTVTRPVAIVCTLAAGALIGVQPPANAALSRHVGDFGAAFISALITFTTLTLLLVVFGHPGRLSGLSGFRPEHALGGLAGATVVAVSLIAVRPLGAGAVVALLVGGQLVISVAADRLGWFGLHEIAISPGRIAGIALVLAGTLLITRS